MKRIYFHPTIFQTFLQTWYFGLSFTDVNGHQSWLDTGKKISKQKVKKENVLKFQFMFKYFPENVEDEVIQDSTLKLLYLQVWKWIINWILVEYFSTFKTEQLYQK